MTKIFFSTATFSHMWERHCDEKAKSLLILPWGEILFLIFKKDICGKGRVFCLLIPLSLLLLLPSLICLHISTLSSLSPGICMRDQVAKRKDWIIKVSSSPFPLLICIQAICIELAMHKIDIPVALIRISHGKSGWGSPSLPYLSSAVTSDGEGEGEPFLMLAYLQ